VHRGSFGLCRLGVIVARATDLTHAPVAACVRQPAAGFVQEIFNPASARGASAVDAIITNVATTNASVADAAMTTPIHEGMARGNLLPDQHLVDSGYPQPIYSSNPSTGTASPWSPPMLADNSAQARAGAGFAACAFHLRLDDLIQVDWSNLLGAGFGAGLTFAITVYGQRVPSGKQNGFADRSWRTNSGTGEKSGRSKRQRQSWAASNRPST
jgi:hypothetical protein